MWALFWGLLIVRYVIDKINAKYQFQLICIIAWIGYQTAKTIWLPLDIQAGMTAVIFIYLGYISEQYKVYEKQVDKPLIILSLFVTAWCIKYFNGFWMVSNFYGNGFMDILGAIASIYLLILFCKKIIYLKVIAGFLEWYGKNSIIILCFHIIELNLIPWNIVININNIFVIVLCKIIWVTIAVLIVNKFKVLEFLFKGNGYNDFIVRSKIK